MDFQYSDVAPLSRFVTDTGKILPRNETGLSQISETYYETN